MGIFTLGLCAAGNCTTLAPTDEKYSDIIKTLDGNVSPCDESGLNPLAIVQNFTISGGATADIPVNLNADILTNKDLFLAGMKENELLKIDIYIRSTNSLPTNSSAVINATMNVNFQSTAFPAANVQRVQNLEITPIYSQSPADANTAKVHYPKQKVGSVFMTKKCLSVFNTAILTFNMNFANGPGPTITLQSSLINPNKS